ncbi:nischarin isoform X2 [Cylas formicarius]|uniref:nischarin isoform X2 n=1 Tax=Cylas formicarius TaxID=197179 RepID=UPI0029584299|nr:nischarin isoform X2 [Cylas formicarius]
MACLLLRHNETDVQIPTTEEVESITFYKIIVRVGEVSWKVDRRYNEFHILHNQLVADHGISKDILPSKKDLSVRCFEKAESILPLDNSYTFTPLELYSISEFLSKPFPIIDNIDNKLDLSSVLELCAQLDKLTIQGSCHEYLQSNIVFNALSFELSSFKVIKSLCLKNVDVNMIYSLGNLRSTVLELQVHDTQIISISQILQCDVLHKDTIIGSEKWSVLKTLDLSNNKLEVIDGTISLAKNLTSLNLSNNKIPNILNLVHLPNLQMLNLTNNLITVCEDLHTKLGNILTLNLSQNGIVTTKGFRKLYSLETLDLSCNRVTQIEEIKYIAKLPCLENLILTGNGVSTSVDYRVTVLEYFGNRAKYICLDNERPTQAELDKVSVMHALRILKEGKTPNLLTEKFSGEH